MGMTTENTGGGGKKHSKLCRQEAVAGWLFVLPISGVLIATIAIFNFTGTWNSYLVPSTFISTLEKFVLVVGLQTVNNEHFQQENLTLAGVFLLSFPVIIFFMFTQKFFVQGIATSGIKS